MAANAGTLEVLHLEPFIHQVGGQSSILQLDETTICKPFISQEYNFYIDIPDVLKPFAPEFRGDIEVTFTTDSEGYITLTTNVSERYNAICQNSKCDSTAFQKQKSERAKCRIRIGHSGSVEIVNSSDDDAVQVFQEGDRVDGSNGISHNPWSLRCLRRLFNKLSSGSTSPASQSFSVKFILLENLTYKYTYPCVLDLKMGTRQFGDDATLAKRQLHEAKVASTTSKTLGARLCGMQVYHLNSGHFVCHNKYYGQGLSVEGFRQALYSFLHNGQKFRQDVIAPLIRKLRMMHDVVQQLDTFRFYTCSLLILYDGITEESCLQNLSSNRNDNTEKNRNSIQLKCNKDKETAKQSQNITAQVDVRLIDFAHATHCNLPQNTMAHIGPDKGLLFGLQNLIHELECINQEYS